MYKPNMRVCLTKKKIYLNRAAIAILGNPTHLCLQYDEQNGALYFSPAASDDLDAYEIPKFYWTDCRHACEIGRIALLKALQFRQGWADGSKYYFYAKTVKDAAVPTLVYMLTEGNKVR